MVRAFPPLLLLSGILAAPLLAAEPEEIPPPRVYADFDLGEYLPPSKAKTTQIQKGVAAPAAKVPGYLGVQFDLAKTPIRVLAIDPAGSFGKSELKVSDVVTQINGQSFSRPALVREYLRDRFADETMTLTVERQGKTLEVAAKLLAISAPLGGNTPPQRAVIGIQTDNDKLGLKVTRVTGGSAAEKAGVKLDDVITRIDDKEMKESEAFNDAMSGKKPGDKILVTLVRGKDELKKEVTLGGQETGGNGAGGAFSWDARSARTFKRPVYKLAVLPISYSDQPLNPKIGTKAWEEALFSTNSYRDKSATGQPVYGSVNDYYQEISCGALRVEGKAFAPVQVAQKRADYSANASRTALFVEVLELLRKRDGEKCLEGFDGLFFLYAGSTATTQRASLYWPHRSTFSNKGERWDYFVCPEGGDRMADISTITHEFGHMLGLPDLYAKPENPGSEGVGGWCAMSQQGRGGRVQHFGAWCKEQLGWLKPAVIDPAVPQKLILSPIEGTTDQCFKVLVRPDGSEYFLLENRSKIGADKVLSGEGLLIWRFVDGKLTLEESHGITTPGGPNQFLSSVPYPTRSNTAFTPQTIPSSKPVKSGGKDVFITQIRRLPDGKITFHIGYEFY